MLTSNLWIATGLVNGSLRKIVSMFYKESLSPPQLLTFVAVNFYKYVGPRWDPNNPTHLSIPPIKRDSCTRMPLKMAWGLTIHKSQGMTLPKSIIDIHLTERQGLAFKTISRVPSLQDLCISTTFSFECFKIMKDNCHVNRRKKEEALLCSFVVRVNLLWYLYFKFHHVNFSTFYLKTTFINAFSLTILIFSFHFLFRSFVQLQHP